MRLPFPERISIVAAFYFAAALCAIQQLEGTSATFSLCCFLYILVSTLAFNTGGGLTRPSGAFVFFNSVLGVIIGLCMKAYLGEPADSNLFQPLRTISVYLAGMCMMFVAVYLSRKFSTRHALLGKMVVDGRLQTATVGCLIAGIALTFAGFLTPQGSGSVLSALRQLNRFYPLAIVLGVIYSIRRSGGTRSINLPVVIAGACMFVVGLLGFSKEGMLLPFACWILAAASQRFRVSRGQIVLGILLTIFIFRYLVPYSQYGRNFREEDGSINFAATISLLADLGNVREQFIETSADSYEERILGYYNTPQGFFDRLQMESIDDALINRTVQFGTFGAFPILQAFENVVPHFLWRDKPFLLSGNVYAHEVGVLAEQDESTGVSFSSTATAYHLEGWPGIFLLAPAIWFLLFFVFDSLCGDVRRSPWGLLVLVVFTHAAPEGDIGNIIYMTFYTAFGIVFAAVVGAYVMPAIGALFIGPESIQLRSGAPVRSIAGRLLSPSTRPTQAS